MLREFKAFAHANMFTVTRKPFVLGLISNSIILKIHMNYLGFFPQL